MLSIEKGKGKARFIAAAVIVVIFIAAMFAWLWRQNKTATAQRQRKAIARKTPLHPEYMTLAKRQALADKVRSHLPQPQDSDIKIKVGKNKGFELTNRIGSLSKYASSFMGKTDDGSPFAVRVYAVPRYDRSPVERRGLDRATQLLQQGCTGSMPIVYGCYHTTRCRVAKPYDGPDTGVCHIVFNELANMDAEQWLQTKPSLDQVKAVLFQVVHALYCLLCCSYERHGDLKASNVLISLEPVGDTGRQYQLYQLDDARYYLPWTGVRATLWDFEFLKPINVRENKSAETLDSEKVVREFLFFHRRVAGSKDTDPVLKHLLWMRETIHHDPTQPLQALLTRLFREYQEEPAPGYITLDSFCSPTKMTAQGKQGQWETGVDAAGKETQSRE